MRGVRNVDILDSVNESAEMMRRRALLNAASVALTGRPYANNAKPAPPANRAQRRADEQARKKLERKKRKKGGD